MDDGDFHLTDDGSLEMNSAGEADICTPCEITLTLAGIDITGCCDLIAAGVSVRPKDDPDINGTYTLAKTSTGEFFCLCGYGYTDLAAFTMERFQASACNDQIGDADAQLFWLGKFYDDGGGLRFYVQGIIVSGNAANRRFTFFRGKTDVIAGPLLVDGEVITNEGPGCGADDTVADTNTCWINATNAIGDGAGTVTVSL